ncbi:hypothetical protein, partial [Actinomadura rubrisoli]|uniref:hypothetical protein n=1 Tax=Actinomadura rubrisoli TaxID=2530368 RepID=UPI001A9FC444
RRTAPASAPPGGVASIDAGILTSTMSGAHGRAAGRRAGRGKASGRVNAHVAGTAPARRRAAGSGTLIAMTDSQGGGTA